MRLLETDIARHQGTIFGKTRTALRVWFAAAWYITSQKQGVSALGLQRVLGLGSDQAAWAMLHRFRRAMVHPECIGSPRYSNVGSWVLITGPSICDILTNIWINADTF